MLNTATRTIPFANIQPQLFDGVAASMAALGTREPALNLDQRSPVPVALIFKLSHQLTPASIADSLSQLMVFYHVLHSQVLNGNRLVFPHQSSRQLVKHIFSSIRNLSLYPRYAQSGFVPIARAFHLTAKRFVSFAQLLELGSVPFRVRDFLAVAQRQQSADTQVNANLFINRWQRLSINVYQQRNSPPSSGRKFYRDSRRLNAFRQQPAPTNRQRLSTFSQVDLTVFVSERCFSKLSAVTVTLLFEVRVLGPPREEVSESPLQVPQPLLKRYAANFFEERQLSLFLPAGQQLRSIVVANPLLLSIPSLCPCRQCFVVDQKSAA